MPEHLRPAWVEVDLDAIEANVALLSDLAAPATFCAVVKADGYGHGAVPVARAALAGGASCLAVALVEEGLALRDAGIEAPVLVLSEPTPEAMEEAIAANLLPTLYRLDGVAAARRAASGRSNPIGVHVKVDTGMHRVGCDPEELPAVAAAVVDAPELRFAGLWTHLAVADDPDDPFTREQLERFATARGELAAFGLVAEVHHAANSAGLVAFPEARLDWVRSGIACYGHLPAPGLEPALAAATGGATLRPALSLRSRVHLVRHLAAGERTSYGLAYRLAREANVAVVPLGYHDGVPRALFEAGGEVLIGGRRCPIAGTVTMDQIIVDCGATPVELGDEVVLIGSQGDEEITAEEWAMRLGTIVYEVLCGIGSRVPRLYEGRSAGPTTTHR